MSRPGYLLLNLGTPDSSSDGDVAKYLREFLMDPYVIDIPWLFRFALVNYLIPKRSKDSAKLYRKVWMAEGSPLMVHSRNLETKVRERMKAQGPVELAMRYGSPSIESALKKLVDQGITELTVLPLYPQFSLAATVTGEKAVKKTLQKLAPQLPVKFVPPFYQHDAYLSAVTDVSRNYPRARQYDLVLFSFHGLPERQVKKTDPTGRHCLASEKCCDEAVPANKDCYRHQCYVTARLLAERLGINPLRYVVCFQSRLGGTPWIKPYTDEFYRTLPSRGIKRLLVFSPSFVADCLETLEEVAIRGKEEFLRHGGEELVLVPSLNDAESWVNGVCRLLSS